jgi:hypothetical protein
MEPVKTSTEGQVMGIIGIVLGIISLIVAFIPCIGVVAFLPGILAIVFSIISIVQATRGSGSKGLGIVSLIISIVAVLFAAIWLMIFSGASIIAKKALDDPEKFELFEKGLKDALKKEFEDTDNTVRIDSLENRLRELEGEMKQLEKEPQPKQNDVPK